MDFFEKEKETLLHGERPPKCCDGGCEVLYCRARPFPYPEQINIKMATQVEEKAMAEEENVQLEEEEEEEEEEFFTDIGELFELFFSERWAVGVLRSFVPAIPQIQFFFSARTHG